MIKKQEGLTFAKIKSNVENHLITQNLSENLLIVQNLSENVNRDNNKANTDYQNFPKIRNSGEYNRVGNSKDKHK